MILSENYIREYTSIKEIDNVKNIKNNNPIILVPEKYRGMEKDVKKRYIQYLSSDRLQIKDVNIIYIKDGYTYDIVSSIKYERDYEIKDSIIILFNGEHYSDSTYYHGISSGEVFFKCKDRAEFVTMLSEYGLGKIYSPCSMLTPYMVRLDNYNFYTTQTLIFAVLFTMTLFFITYISNYITMNVNSKRYALKREHGYSVINILSQELVVQGVMVVMAIALYFFNLNIVIFIGFIMLDFIMMLYFYNKVIVRDMYKIMNGGV